MHVQLFGVIKAHQRAHIELHLAAVQRHTVQVVGWLSHMHDVLQRAQRSQADVVIMDPALDGGRLLQQWVQRAGATPVLICWSESDQFASLAFEAGAVHYLGPHSAEAAMIEAIDRSVTRLVRYDRDGSNGNGHLLRESRKPLSLPTIALPGYDGIEVRPAHRIMCAHGIGGYTQIILVDDPPILLSKSLGELEPDLAAAGLLRVHRSHMVNPTMIRRVYRGKSPRVVMSNGEEVDVSLRYREVLYTVLNINSVYRERGGTGAA